MHPVPSASLQSPYRKPGLFHEAWQRLEAASWERKSSTVRHRRVSGEAPVRLPCVSPGATTGLGFATGAPGLCPNTRHHSLTHSFGLGLRMISPPPHAVPPFQTVRSPGLTSFRRPHKLPLLMKLGINSQFVSYYLIAGNSFRVDQ